MVVTESEDAWPPICQKGRKKTARKTCTSSFCFHVHMTSSSAPGLTHASLLCIPSKHEPEQPIDKQEHEASSQLKWLCGMSHQVTAMLTPSAFFLRCSRGPIILRIRNTDKKYLCLLYTFFQVSCSIITTHDAWSPRLAFTCMAERGYRMCCFWLLLNPLQDVRCFLLDHCRHHHHCLQSLAAVLWLSHSRALRRDSCAKPATPYHK